jgi:hypothetical protein
VRYADVEEMFRKYAPGIIELAPRGQNTEALERKIESHGAHIDRLMVDADGLAEELRSNKSVAVRRKLREIETEIEERQEELRTLNARRDTLTSAGVRRKLEALQKALGHEPFDVVQVNIALKQAVQKIVMDVERASLDIYWHHVDEDALPQQLSFYSRHKRWETAAVEGNVEEAK